MKKIISLVMIFCMLCGLVVVSAEDTLDANVVLKDGRNVGDIRIKRGLARPYNGGRRAGWCE